MYGAPCPIVGCRFGAGNGAWVECCSCLHESEKSCIFFLLLFHFLLLITSHGPLLLVTIPTTTSLESYNNRCHAFPAGLLVVRSQQT